MLPSTRATTLLMVFAVSVAGVLAQTVVTPPKNRYYLTIVQEKDAGAFQNAFQRVGESIRLTEAR